MFGNLQGWIVAVLMAVGTAALIVHQGRSPARSAPTGSLAAAMPPTVLVPPPESVLPPGTKDLDAATFYRALAAQVQLKERQYDEFQDSRKPKRETAKPLEADLGFLLQGAECRHMNLFAGNPAEVVNFSNRKPVLPELERAGNAAIWIAALDLTADSSKPGSKPANPERGLKLLQAVFQLGRFLAAERVVFEEYRVGTALLGNAATNLSRYGKYDDSQKAAFGDLAKATALGHDVESLIATMTEVPSVGQTVSSPGDVFEVALNSQNPMWRTEAVLKLGRMRFMAGVSFADQRDATRVVNQIAAQEGLPPNVRAAAHASKELTVERFRMIGGSS